MRILYHTHMVYTVRVWYIPYAYGTILYIPYADGMTIWVWYVPYAYSDIYDVLIASRLEIAIIVSSTA